MTTLARSRFSFYLAAGIFLASLLLGFWLASHKPVWNDEIYTQITSVEKPSYTEILTLDFEEGNMSPLFYVLQKGVCQLAGYRFPQMWRGEWTLSELRSQLILRIQPNVLMSLSIALIFWYFARYDSWAAGAYALMVALSSYMVGAYGLEARPYALWFFLTTLQSLLLLAILQGRGNRPRLLQSLAATHVLFSLTVVFSLVQIVSGALVLVLARKADIKQALWITVVPAGICLYYYFFAPKFQFWFAQGPWQLVGASLPKDRLLIIFLYTLTLSVRLFRGRGIPSRDQGSISRPGACYLGFTALMLASAFAVLLLFKLNESTGQKGFMISNRYFIYLAPIGIIAVTLFSIEMVRAVRNKFWLLLPLVGGLGGLTFFRVYRTLMLLRETYRF